MMRQFRHFQQLRKQFSAFIKHVSDPTAGSIAPFMLCPGLHGVSLIFNVLVSYCYLSTAPVTSAAGGLHPLSQTDKGTMNGGRPFPSNPESRAYRIFSLGSRITAVKS